MSYHISNIAQFAIHAAPEQEKKGIRLTCRELTSCYVFESLDIPGLYAAHSSFEAGLAYAKALAKEFVEHQYGGTWDIEFSENDNEAAFGEKANEHPEKQGIYLVKHGR